MNSTNSSQCGQNSNNSKITFMQHNTAKSQANMYTILQYGVETLTDFLLVQEPWMRDSKNTISNSAYYTILPDTLEKPRVVIYARKESIFEFCQLDDCKDPDIIMLEISGPGIEKFRIFNVYNERRETENSNNWTVERSLQSADITNSAIICGDFNAHHRWWNSRIRNPVRSQNLVDWLHKRNCELLNIPD
jgi:hypothetical protein